MNICRLGLAPYSQGQELHYEYMAFRPSANMGTDAHVDARLAEKHWLKHGGRGPELPEHPNVRLEPTTKWMTFISLPLDSNPTGRQIRRRSNSSRKALCN
jgi:hypothetical protein